MNAKGFALIEWLVAAALTITIAGAAFALVVPVRDVIERTQHRTDLVTAVRGSLDVIVQDLREGGAGAGIEEAADVPLNPSPTVEVLDSLASGVGAFTGTAVRIRHTPLAAPQGRLGKPAVAGELLLLLDPAAHCAFGAPSCGFESGDRALVFAQAASAVVTVKDVVAGGLVLTNGLGSAFPAGAVVCKVVTTVYGFKNDAAGARVVRITEGGAEQPLVDQVVAFQLAATPMGLSLRLRVQAADIRLRGPAGYLFANAGTAAGPRQWLPDVELRAEVALRNGTGIP
jgi:hypothetical protein